jgi:hypothetical protein
MQIITETYFIPEMVAAGQSLIVVSQKALGAKASVPVIHEVTFKDYV